MWSCIFFTYFNHNKQLAQIENVEADPGGNLTVSVKGNIKDSCQNVKTLVINVSFGKYLFSIEMLLMFKCNEFIIVI